MRLEATSYLDISELREALSAAQDEIERRITECEGHRALIDAVRDERAAELALSHMPDDAGWAATTEAIQRVLAACEHRRALVDSMGGKVTTRHPIRCGWTAVLDSPSFEAARATHRARSVPWLAPTMDAAHSWARKQSLISDTHKAKVFWVVLDA